MKKFIVIEQSENRINPAKNVMNLLSNEDLRNLKGGEETTECKSNHQETGSVTLIR